MKKERLKALLEKCLLWIIEENGDFFATEVSNTYEWFETAIGITEKELNELGIDWLDKGENND